MATTAPLAIRPGLYFWAGHLAVDGVFLFLAGQLVVASMGAGDAAHLVAGVASVTLALASGARVLVRIDDRGILIRNPWYSVRLNRGAVDAVTAQSMWLAAPKQSSSNCVAIWERGAAEGWPVVATLGRPSDVDLYVDERFTATLGTKVDRGRCNRGWRPGSFRRRRGDVRRDAT